MKQKTLLFLKTKKHRLRELSVICTACIVNWNDYQVNCLEYTQYYHYNYNGCRYVKDLPRISPLCQVFTRCVNGKHNFTYDIEWFNIFNAWIEYCGCNWTLMGNCKENRRKTNAIGAKLLEWVNLYWLWGYYWGHLSLAIITENRNEEPNLLQ